MKDISKILESLKKAKDPTSGKITRFAFLYMDPKSPKTRFAQCSTCMLWTGGENNTCVIHGKDLKITGDMTCGLYAHGTPMPSWAGQEQKSVTPKESGLYKGEVRCENCKYGSEDGCGLFIMLNKLDPDTFNLDPKIDPKGCCNAWTK